MYHTLYQDDDVNRFYMEGYKIRFQKSKSFVKLRAADEKSDSVFKW